MIIEESLYKQMVGQLPIICVDIIIKDSSGKYLLVKRGNEPLKGEYWVIGGRISHTEKAVDAACRKLNEEASISVEPIDLTLVGYYEDVFEKNSFEENIYHTLSIVFELKIDTIPLIELDSQSTEWIMADQLPERFYVRKF